MSRRGTVAESTRSRASFSVLSLMTCLTSRGHSPASDTRPRRSARHRAELPRNPRSGLRDAGEIVRRAALSSRCRRGEDGADVRRDSGVWQPRARASPMDGDDLPRQPNVDATPHGLPSLATRTRQPVGVHSRDALHGKFFTIWRQEPGGQWRWVFDLGAVRP
jgi:hypothetical protein